MSYLTVYITDYVITALVDGTNSQHPQVKEEKFTLE